MLVLLGSFEKVLITVVNFQARLSGLHSCSCHWAFSLEEGQEVDAFRTRFGWLQSQLRLHGRFAEQDLKKFIYPINPIGWPTTAFNYIRDNGIASATKYSYKGVKETCKRDKNVTSVLKIPNVCEVFLNGQEDKLKNLIAQYGPVSGALCKLFRTFSE